MSQTEAAMAQAQLAMLERAASRSMATATAHPRLLAQYQHKASAAT